MEYYIAVNNFRMFCCQQPPGRVTLTLIDRLRLVYFCWLSKPSSNRLIYRAICQHNVRKIVELGMGDGSRALRMIETVQRQAPGTEIHYVGMDPFEGQTSSGGSGLCLKEAYQVLRTTGAKVQLVPGNPAEGIVRMANSLGKVDLLILPAEFEGANCRAWNFVPRMLHEDSLVFVETIASDGQRSVRPKSRAEIDRLVSAATGRRVAA